MRAAINRILSVVIILFFTSGNCQENELLKHKEQEIVSNWNNFSEMGFIDQNNNLIYVSQIGSLNHSDIVIISDKSNIVLKQDGNNNQMELHKSAPEINQTISQSGDHNFVSDFSLFSGKKINMSINQEGNNLTIFNNGTNSISKDLKITQTGNSGTVYIFNH